MTGSLFLSVSNTFYLLYHITPRPGGKVQNYTKFPGKTGVSREEDGYASASSFPSYRPVPWATISSPLRRARLPSWAGRTT